MPSGRESTGRTRPRGARTSKVWRSLSRAGSVIWDIRPTMMESRVRTACTFLRPPRFTGPLPRVRSGVRASGLRTGWMALLGQIFSHMPQPEQELAVPFFWRMTALATCSCTGVGHPSRDTVRSLRSTVTSMASKVQAATQEPHIVHFSGSYSIFQLRSLNVTSCVLIASICAPPGHYLSRLARARSDRYHS
jgi:hypothetical protein